MSQEVLDLVVEKVHGFLGEEVLAFEEPEPPAEEPEEEEKPARRKKPEPKVEKPADLNFGRPMIILDSKKWTLELAKMFRDDEELQFDFLSCVTGVDYEEHMEVIYNFYSTTKDHYLYVKVKTPRDNPSVVSVEPLWKAADYMERETYDLFGIDFPGHWNLRRILLQDDWEGHPLRKDYITDKKALGLD
ncbi:NADH-quinone oxidoreductase subunit C [Evansella tamaricis]|uniref:NADH-quinone oxidoreductase n=1 Tax=Evansella tamaricis TaxID=2069301 RepID=A0ABS6JBV1_9BACI|nr:NADH-quinone oxidoreductase subunit C [Evansella tamaricis]MBU9710317.1 NADH-quinone oxidoreductase subunit C [Evansella tamaricis]